LILHSRQKGLFSFFDTEKYGTMTVIPKKEEFLDTSYKVLGDDIRDTLITNNQELITNVQYEITPFRTETTYSDGRHPDEVVRSNSLLLDSQRRDFTINSIYYCKLATSPSFPLPVGEG
jgi:tRNA nucleotidyltransferase/poly(A) polymerase